MGTSFGMCVLGNFLAFGAYGAIFLQVLGLAFTKLVLGIFLPCRVIWENFVFLIAGIWRNYR